MVTLDQVTIRFRGPALLDEVTCLIEAKQRIGLLGRNGAGKSTLLKMIQGEVEPDHGSVIREPGVHVAFLPQAVPEDLHGSIRTVVSGGVLQTDKAAWECEHEVDKILSQMQLDPDVEVAQLSAGMKRRVLLAQSIVSQPDLLLLDEPTNHLDLDSICWLEDFLHRYPRAFMFVTHDRQFLRRLANRILEIEAGQIFDWSCDYDTFLQRKEAELEASEKQNRLFDKRLAEEEAWIRQGIKARRTRNEGRVRALKKMREERLQRREKTGISNLQIQEGIRSGNVVVRAQNVSFQYPVEPGQEKLQGVQVIQDFNATIFRGDKVGIIGPNGAGKTTLLRLMLGELRPSEGELQVGINLQIVYFDQLRDQLNEDSTVEEAVADGYQTVHINGKPRHVLGYLQDFLFDAERSRTKISHLSGGERNRVLLAKLFTKPANVIVLDEPTNDLDFETMEMLEQRLVEYAGTLLLVSHDREFLNNIVTSVLAFEDSPGQGYRVCEYVGGYDEWKRQASQRSEAASEAQKKSKQQTQPATAKATPAKSNTKRGLSFRESKELEKLPGRIEELETTLGQLHQQMADPAFYKSAGDEISAVKRELETVQAELDASYLRWQELEELSEP
ncbi:MAG: ATP-binding cassette domain-containing protein [bacterium]|nr:ATP-binding cassette domain-containing protein [bacterium]